jgi:hypothetical protein
LKEDEFGRLEVGSLQILQEEIGAAHFDYHKTPFINYF